MGKGTTSVMENSRTLNAGDKIAHYTQTISTHTHIHTTQNKCTLAALYITDLQYVCTVNLGNKLSVLEENLYLKCTASSDSFVCVQCGADVFAEEFGDPLFNSWHSRSSSNYLHCIDIIPAQFCHKTHTRLNSFVTYIILKQHSQVNPTKSEGHTWVFKGCFQWHLYSH